MADNTVLNPGLGGDTISTDDLSTLNGVPVTNVKAERVKVGYGADGVLTDVDAGHPLPVTDAISEAALTSIAAEDFATSAKQSDGSQKTQLVDASGNVIGSTGNGLDVNIKSGNVTLVAEDIEIGAVELKNAGTDDRVAVINAAPTTEFGVVTRNIPSGTQAVSASSLPLPTGAATAANQQTNALTDAQLRATPVPVSGTITPSGTQDENLIQIGGTSVDVNSGNKSAGTQRVVIATDQPQLTNAWKVDGSAVTQPVSGTFFQATQPVSVASLPLPAGAATAANQQTNALTDTQLRATAVPVSNASLPLPSGASTSTKQSDGSQKSQIVDGSGNVIGATSNALDINIKSGNPAAITNYANETGGNLAAIKADVDKIPSLGQAVAASSVPVVLTAAEETILSALLTISDFDTKTGSLTETAPTTDTASSGLNGRLQRIAQRISSLVTALGSPFQAGASLAANQSVNVNQLAGTTTDTNSGSKSAGTLRVVLATDQPVLTNSQPVKSTQKPSVGATTVLTVTNLQSLASSATAGWQSARVSNVPTTLANDYEIFVKLTTANTTPANDKCMYVFICPFYTTDAGTTWFAASQGTTTLPTGTEGTTTIASPHNLRLLGVLNYTTAQAVVQDCFLLSNCFGNRMPDGFSIVIINFSGAALSTGCVVDYSPINDSLV